MDNKTLSIVSYITIIGWLVAYFAGKDNADALLKYHLRQSLGLVIFGFLFSIAVSLLIFIVPVLGLVAWVVNLFVLVLLILGIINANNGELKPLPVIGKYFEDKFAFIG